MGNHRRDLQEVGIELDQAVPASWAARIAQPVSLMCQGRAGETVVARWTVDRLLHVTRFRCQDEPSANTWITRVELAGVNVLVGEVETAFLVVGGSAPIGVIVRPGDKIAVTIRFGRKAGRWMGLFSCVAQG